ncbi:MAG: hypothetical protein V4562_06515 [Pseudomonadota bacterium]
MPADKNHANTIRTALAAVERLRTECQAAPALATAVSEVKALQARRFAGTYADLLQDRTYQPAARFFLEELYSDTDYSARDAQFARIAGALQKFFPAAVVATATALAQLHALTEALDHAMGNAWLAHPQLEPAQRYVAAWQSVGRRTDRDKQLRDVLQIGRELELLTRMTGLRLMLKMMRGAANAAGMGSLQKFLESGFDTFAAMGKQKCGTAFFLETVEKRESELIAALFDSGRLEATILLDGFLSKVR